jgi:oligopeptidase B
MPRSTRGSSVKREPGRRRAPRRTAAAPVVSPQGESDMNRVTRSVLAVAAAAVPVMASADGPAPPVAERIPHADTTLGEVRQDPYHWLRDKADPRVIAHLEAENAYTAAMLKSTEALQESLFGEMRGRIKETDLSVPEKDGPWLYYTRTEQGRQYPIWCRKHDAPDAPEEVLLDANALAQPGHYFRVGAFRPSPDHRLLAWSTDTTGAEYYTVFVKDLATGTLLPDRIAGIEEDLEWANDNHTLFYTLADSAKRPDRVARHVLGTDAANDVVVFNEPDALFNVELSRSHDRSLLQINVESFASSEAHILDAGRPMDVFRRVTPRRRNVLYHVQPHGDELFIHTNEGAPNFKLMRAPVRSPGRANWKPFVPASDTVLIDDFEVFRDHLALFERGGGRRGIRIVDLRTGRSHQVSFPEAVYTYNPVRTPDYDSRLLRFVYSSFVTPPTVIDYDMARRTRTVLKRTEVPNYDPAPYRTERVWARARDGTRVPMSLLYRAPLQRDGRRPLLLYGYGAYGISSDPGFSSNIFSLVDRGVVFAIAHIRGGQEMGRRWYDQGKLLHKKNTFTDFVDCAEALIRTGVTSRDRLVIRGGSAGGLLIGAVLNMRPDLFHAAVADVPFVDVINTMSDPSIPLTTQEWEQWGDPRTPRYYAYMKSYSPYDNVHAAAYPNLLVTAGLNDPRVGYWEPAKWVAKLRATKTDGRPLLLRVNMGAGHGGASGRYDNLREQALRYAFVLHALGLDTSPPAGLP